jgi:hypothetical protein
LPKCARHWVGSPHMEKKKKKLKKEHKFKRNEVELLKPDL